MREWNRVIGMLWRRKSLSKYIYVPYGWFLSCLSSSSSSSASCSLSSLLLCKLLPEDSKQDHGVKWFHFLFYKENNNNDMVASTNLNIIVSIEIRSNDVALFWLDSIIRSYHRNLLLSQRVVQENNDNFNHQSSPWSRLVFPWLLCLAGHWKWYLSNSALLTILKRKQ